MPLNDERPASTSSGEDQGSDVESSSERCDSMTSTSDLDCSRESFTSDCSSKHCTPSCEFAHWITSDLLFTFLCPWLLSFVRKGLLVGLVSALPSHHKNYTYDATLFVLFDFSEPVFYLWSHSRNIHPHHCHFATSKCWFYAPTFLFKLLLLIFQSLFNIWFPQQAHPKP